MKVGFIGLGKLGMQCAEVFATKYKTFGYDIVPKNSDLVEIVPSVEKLVQKSDMIFISVQTPHDKQYGGEQPSSHLPLKDFNYSILEDVVEDVNRYSDHSKVLIIISTVLPGTIRNRIKSIANKCFLVYNPYLIAMGTVKEDFCNPEMVILGTENGDTNNEKLFTLIDIYKSLIQQNSRFEIGTWEEAESIKIFYNTFISAKIAFVNMIQDVAENIGNMNVDVVTEALTKSTKRVISSAYMKAGMGDGGPCHPRDNIALSSLADRLDLRYDLFKVISESRELQAKKITEKLIKFANPIVILGTNYKPNTELTDGSYALLVSYYLKESGAEFYLNHNPSDNIICTYLICHENIYNDFPFYSNSIIFDMWRSFKTSRTDLKIYSYGNTRKRAS